MSGSTIGIKIANGSYYPILEREQAGRKRLILTTVKDEQPTVQIDLYEGDGKEIADASYIGSLLIEDIQAAAKGEPEIELLLGVDREGTLSADAKDLATGESQSLSVSLQAEADTYDIPEFEFDDDLGSESGDSEVTEESFEAASGLSDLMTETTDVAGSDGFADDEFSLDAPVPDLGETSDDGSALDASPTSEDDPFGGDGLEIDEFDEFKREFGDDEEEDASDQEPFVPLGLTPDDAEGTPPEELTERKRQPLLLAAFIIFGVAAVGAIAVLIFQLLQGPKVPALEARAGESPSAVAAGAPAAGSPAASTPAASTTTSASAAASAASGSAGAGSQTAAGAGSTAAATGGTAEQPRGSPKPTETLGGAWYWIRWGDTLWDISSSFYTTPWLYETIALKNSIRNPDLIYAGTRIFIPEKN